MEEKENLIVCMDNTESLQDSFSKFLQAKKREIKNRSFTIKNNNYNREDPEFRNQLRQKFIDRAKHYIGTPYAQRYHEPGTDAYNSPLFLDCCGLVRQVVFDLSSEFGFTLCRWNQAYQSDTLDYVNYEDMKPGDLVFLSGTYYSPKMKKQIHDMVHVEIFLGGETGEQTIGARWWKGRVQIFDTYKFVSTNYYDIKYHYKSIDRWLHGICQSVCPEHKWVDDRKNRWMPRNSIFMEESCEAVEEIQDGTIEEERENVRNERIERDCIAVPLEIETSAEAQSLMVNE
ncbi:unnamed protein product [Blepharisma stoltei]|uniref:NlpC/P60 domain-containing protein n=1 Tax=Blepharisma stoltei TaxID=1481888 RepID=A0AAU9K8M9_9CILI|nr:unnamed protein product [Blepharisma stoltei]